MSENSKMSALFSLPEKTFKAYTNSIKVEGIILIILGSIALLMPFLFARVLESFLGALFLIVGVFGLLRVVKTKIIPGTVFSALLYILFIVTGIMIFKYRYSSISVLATIIGVMFFISGFFKVAFAFRIKPAKNWIWSLIDGLITLILGMIIFSQWPLSGIVVISVMVGIKMLFLGYAMIMLASGIKNTDTLKSSTI
jgi:uncharacterized membrane protein HdeD (DUF308 family)